MTNPEVLLEDNHLLAFNKPAGVLTMGDQTGDVTMVEVATHYLRERYHKPGNVFVGVVHRLDRPVSGVLLMTRTSKAAARLSDQFRRGRVRKTYVAEVEDHPTEDHGQLVDYLWKDRAKNLVHVVPESHPNGQRCVLNYRVLERRQRRCLLEIEPLTGRSHQIRVQLASLGNPIAGDSKYGASSRQGGRILLHAASLEFEHPTKKEPVRVTSPADFC